jgi:protein dithiol oxidoreductase (disulfide-forming)
MRHFKAYLRLAACLLGLVLSAGAAAQLAAGKDYRLINPPQPTDSGKKVEVLEFFYYGCPHCANLQPSLRNWLKRKPADVEFRRAPAVFDEAWYPLTWAYHTFDVMGLLDKLHYEVFAAIHQQRIRLSDQKVLFDWVAKQGVDRKQFIDTYNSFGVKSRGMRSIEMTRDYDIPGTPALTVDGKYLLAPSMFLKPDKTLDYERLYNALDQVIAMARKERAGK